jgi:hypothetical protein
MTVWSGVSPVLVTDHSRRVLEKRMSDDLARRSPAVTHQVCRNSSQNRAEDAFQQAVYLQFGRSAAIARWDGCQQPADHSVATFAPR